ncbi:tetratricopeptide repeat protein [Saccharothrix saharensis]|uniref:tetratricopeptide repeat protein n=1 Tax=Saccharothrix saharensis TaxID=571190 RepID=UPI0036B273B9
MADVFTDDVARTPDRRTTDRVVVLSGLGGTGKTQLAADYAEHCLASGEAELVVWITAASRDALVDEYAAVAQAVTGIKDLHRRAGAARLLDWLAATSHRWLLVLDDLQHPSDLTGLWPPPVATGRVVVSTRRRGAALLGHGRRLVEVGLFTSAESAAYLVGKLGGSPERLDGAAELAQALGHLPLALAQAATFVLDRPLLTCADYVRRFLDQRRALVSLLPHETGLPDQHRDTVAATWLLSVEHADRLPPAGLAAPLLRVAALLDPNGIPLTVFTTHTVLDLLRVASGREVSAEQAHDALACLHRLSLIDFARDPVHGEVRVHALVQRATRDHHRDQDALARLVADALVELWPAAERDAPLGQALRSCTAALATIADDELWQPDCHEVLTRWGTSLGTSGQARAALNHFAGLADTAARRLHPDHPQTLVFRGHVADWQGRAGDYSGAVAAYEALIDDHAKAFGHEHLGAFEFRRGFARWWGPAGDPAGAVVLHHRLLVDLTKTVGFDHPDTLALRRDLAEWHGRAGDTAKAVAQLADLLPDLSRVLGTDHPDTLTTRRDLAHWLGRSGNPGHAVGHLEDLLPNLARVLGTDHPDTLTTRRDLAHWHGRTGKAHEAASRLQDMLPDITRVLGPDHRDTLITRYRLASWRGWAGDPHEALRHLGTLHRDFVRVFGPDHPDTMTVERSYGAWDGRAGQTRYATMLFSKLYQRRLRVQGADHPDTIAARRDDDLYHLMASNKIDPHPFDSGIEDTL